MHGTFSSGRGKRKISKRAAEWCLGASRSSASRPHAHMPQASLTHACGLRRALHPVPRQTSERDPTATPHSCNAYRCSSAAAPMAPRIERSMRRLPSRQKAQKRARLQPRPHARVRDISPAARPELNSKRHRRNHTRHCDLPCMRTQRLPCRLQTRRNGLCRPQVTQRPPCALAARHSGRAHCDTSAQAAQEAILR